MQERLARVEQVLWNVVDGEAVLLNTDSGIYFGLNKTATALWSLLEVPRTADELMNALASTFGMDYSVVATDVGALVSTMLEKHLIQRM